MMLPALALASLAIWLPQRAPGPDRTPAQRVRVEGLDGTERVLAGAGELAPELLEGAVLIAFEGFELPATPLGTEEDGAELALAGGQRLFGPVSDGRGDHLEIALLGGARLRVVIDRVQSLHFPGRVAPEALAGLEPASSGDRLYWIRPGGLDRVDGTVEAFEESGVRFDGVLGSKTFPWEQIAALFVEPLGDASGEAGGTEAGEGRAVVVDLADGGRLRGRLTGLSESGAVLAVAASGELALPLGALAEIVADDGKSAFLSSLPPDEALEGSPFGDDLGMRWPHRMDRSVTGGSLISKGVRWSRGIGVHAPSRLVWKLDGGFSELRGAVAIDDTVLLLPHPGSVVFRVLVDGEPRWESPLVRGGQPPVPLAIELSGARELALEVDMATRFHVADRANWLRMLLVR